MNYEAIGNVKQPAYAVTYIHKNNPNDIMWYKSSTFVEGVGYIWYIMLFTDVIKAGAVAATLEKSCTFEGSIWKGTSKRVPDYLDVKIVKINIENMEVIS